MYVRNFSVADIRWSVTEASKFINSIYFLVLFKLKKRGFSFGALQTPNFSKIYKTGNTDDMYDVLKNAKIYSSIKTHTLGIAQSNRDTLYN